MEFTPRLNVQVTARDSRTAPRVESFNLGADIAKQDASRIADEFHDSPASQRAKVVRPWALDRKPTARLLPSLAAPTPGQRPGLDRKHDLEN